VADRVAERKRLQHELDGVRAIVRLEQHRWLVAVQD
jgi:hypothetical protein